MRVTRVVTRLTAVITAVLGLTLVTAGAAAAATESVGVWHPYGNTNPITSSSSTWRCDTSTTVDTNVLAQVCAIRTPDGSFVQAAVIVRNNRSSLYAADAGMDLLTSGGTLMGDWGCPLSGVGAHSWSVCFGETLPTNSLVYARGIVNIQVLGISPNV
jgi:hypothetical protein